MAAGDVVVTRTKTNAKKCASFNGTSDYFSMPSTIGNKVSETNQITVSFWFRVDEFSNAYSYFFAKDSDMVRIFIKRDTGDVSVNYFGLTDTSISAAPAAADGEWHHLITSYNGTHIDLLIDGVSVTPEASTGTLFMSNDTIYVGSYDGTQLYLPGEMANICIWNRGLTTAEKADVYAGVCVSKDLIFKATFKNDTFTDDTGNFVITNNGSVIQIVDSDVAAAMKAQRVTANDKFLIYKGMEGQVNTCSIEEAP